jgi:hypothetical protein
MPLRNICFCVTTTLLSVHNEGWGHLRESQDQLADVFSKFNLANRLTAIRQGQAVGAFAVTQWMRMPRLTGRSRHSSDSPIPANASPPARTFYCPDYNSDRGRYQTNPHISGNVDACVIGEHAAVRNSESQFAAPHLAHINLIAHASDFRRDMPCELHLANADGAAFAR